MLHLPRPKCSKFFTIFQIKTTNLTFFSVCLKKQSMALRSMIHFLAAAVTRYIIKNSDNSNIISHFIQESILELWCAKKGLWEVRNLVYLSYILIKLTVFQGNSDLDKNERMPRAFGRHRSCLLAFFEILFGTFTVDKVFNSRFFLQLFIFVSKIY